MDLMQAIHERRSVREYLDRPLGGEALAAVIGAATWAPSSMNRQPWRFIVVEGRPALRRYAEDARLAMLREAARRPDFTAARHLLDDPRYDIFHDAPALIVICATQSDEFAAHDACLAAQTLMLAAHGFGYGTCWVGFAEPWLASERGRAALGLRPNDRPVAPIIIGVPAALPDAPERRPADIAFASGAAT